MRLYLVQHGEAVSTAQDPARPLSDGGRHVVERLASFLAHLNLGASRILHSGKTRARQTAEMIAWAVGSHLRAEQREGLSPDDPCGDLVAELEAWTGPELIVGHLPFLQRLTGQLLTGNAERSAVRFTPGTAVCLERDGTGTWTLLWCLPPEVLPD